MTNDADSRVAILDCLPVNTVAVIGAGLMGRQIAEAGYRAGKRVLLRDVDNEAAAKAVKRILADNSGTATVSVVTSDEDLTAAELVIECVPENPALKASVYAQLEPVLGDGAIAASNSSSLRISDLAATWSDPGRFCGLHFCHPVAQRPLIEVIGASTTSAATTARAYQYAQSLGMAPVVVRDSPGFVLNRLLVPWMNESLELMLEGADLADLDRAAKDFGMPIRPLALFDEFGIDVALAVGTSMYRTWPERIEPSELLIAVYKSGRRDKSRSQFYATPDDAKQGRLSSSVCEIITKRRRNVAAPSLEQIERRLQLAMLLEATRMLEEDLIDSPDLIDTVLRNGLGLTDRFQGLFAWLNSPGPATLLEWLEPLQSISPRFEPTELLQKAAADDHY